MFLSGCVTAELDRILPAELGWMLQPGNGQKPIGGRYWAADNGCYAAGDRFDAGAWLAWLASRRGDVARCLFATAPDVWGDAAATERRSAPYLHRIRELGYRVAYCAQDGFDGDRLDWRAIDCIFVGGSNPFRGARIPSIAAEAHARGKWMHVGRVNSLRRVRAMDVADVDSVDGTFLAYAPRVNRDRLAGWLAAIDRQPHLL